MKITKLPYSDIKTVAVYNLEYPLPCAASIKEDLLPVETRVLQLNESYYEGVKVFSRYDRYTDTLYVMDIRPI